MLGTEGIRTPSTFLCPSAAVAIAATNDESTHQTDHHLRSHIYGYSHVLPVESMPNFRIFALWHRCHRTSCKSVARQIPLPPNPSQRHGAAHYLTSAVKSHTRAIKQVIIRAYLINIEYRLPVRIAECRSIASAGAACRGCGAKPTDLPSNRHLTQLSQRWG